MQLVLISKHNRSRNADDPWDWLVGCLVGSKEVRFNGNVVTFLMEVYPLIHNKTLDKRLHPEDIEILFEMYTTFRMNKPTIYDVDCFRWPVSDVNKDKNKDVNKEVNKGTNANVNDIFNIYAKQTSDSSPSRNNIHTDCFEHDDRIKHYDDHIDRSLNRHSDLGRDYDDHNDHSQDIHNDWIDWDGGAGIHSDRHSDYEDESHIDSEHSDSYDDYVDHSYNDNHIDNNKHADSKN